MVTRATPTQGTKSLYNSADQGICHESDQREGGNHFDVQVRHPKSTNNPADKSLLLGKSIGTCSSWEEEDKM